jgi:hypothetical protein
MSNEMNDIRQLKILNKNHVIYSRSPCLTAAGCRPFFYFKEGRGIYLEIGKVYVSNNIVARNPL